MRGEVTQLARPKVPAGSIVVGLLAVAGMLIAGLVLGPANLSLRDVWAEVTGNGTSVVSNILWQIRLPRVILALLVGGVLSLAGGAYQGAFRNPLADPYLLGVAGGGGLGATLAIVSSAGPSLVPVFAFVGSLGAVGLTYALGSNSDSRTPAALILAGVAVSSLLTAIQTFVQQRNTEDLRSIYSWILGRLSTQGWSDVVTLLPYAVLSSAVLLLMASRLDVLSVGDVEAQSLGLAPARTRLIIVVAASLATAAAVSVSGLIAFVGIIVPHIVRLVGGSSYRRILPLSFLYGAAFLAFADLIAHVAFAPTELPIGVVTAFFGAPFFLLILRTGKRSA